MLDFQDGTGLKAEWADGVPETGPDRRAPPKDGPALDERRLREPDSLILTKTVAGFDGPTIEALRRSVRDAAEGDGGVPKFLVIDFAHEGEAVSGAGPGFDLLLTEVADLISRAPIVSVAWARGRIAGPDLDLALACSMLAGQDTARFSFAGDPTSSLATYARLVHKLGFVRAERLMEDGEILDAAGMKRLLLMKEIAPAEAGGAAIDAFLKRRAKRHNSQAGIYRAQHITLRYAGAERASVRRP